MSETQSPLEPVVGVHPETTAALQKKREYTAGATSEDAKSSLGVFELPCGLLEYLQAGGPVLHREVVVEELDGRAEDMLASNTPPHLKFGQLIAMSVSRIGPHSDPGTIASLVASLTIGDRIFLLLACRRVTLGDSHYLIEPCANPYCLDPASTPEKPLRSQALYTVSLADVEVKAMPTPMQHVYDRTLDTRKGSVPFRFHVMTGLDEAKIARFKEADARGSLAILARMETYNGQNVALRPDGSNYGSLLDFVQKLPLSVRNQMRDHFESVEGGIDTDLDLTCPRCRHAFKAPLRIDADFFRPSVTLARWRAMSPTSCPASAPTL